MNHQQFINFTSDRVHQKAYTYMYRSLYNIRLFLRTNDLSLQNIIDDTYTHKREKRGLVRQYYSE